MLHSIRNLDRSTVWFVIVLLTAVLFPWHERASSIGILLLVMHWLWDRNLLYKMRQLKLGPEVWLCWAFFFYHLLALVWSPFRWEGWHSVEVKLSFLILPLLFGTENYLNAEKRKALEWTFAVSCALSFVYCIIQSWLAHPQAGYAVIFQRMNISEPLMHPGYYSNYFAFAVVLLALNLWENRRRPAGEQWPAFLLIGFFLFALLALISKTAVLYLLLFAGFMLWRLTSGIAAPLLRYGVYLLFVLFMGVSFFLIPSVNRRYTETVKETVKVAPQELLISNSTGTRLAAWDLEWELISERPVFGYGTGAANPLLLESLKKNGYTNLVKHELHTHNQILHTWIDLGLPGLFLMLGLFLWIGFVLVFKQKDQAGAWMIVLILANILTDDMLEIQAGAVFFVFFTMLYLYRQVGYKRPLRYSY